MGNINRKFSSLERVYAKDVFGNEATGFTPWLKASDFALLSESIGINIEWSERERPSGDFRIDIFAREASTGKKVIIENQYGKSDHDHLGKCLTYAGGEDADMVVWICEEARDEHIQSIKWLNERTDSKTNFFFVEVHIFRIDDSNEAIDFRVIEKPSQFKRYLRQVEIENTGTELQQLYFEFWCAFIEYCDNEKTELRITQEPSPRSFFEIVLPNYKKAFISLNFDTRLNEIRCDLIFKKSFSTEYTNWYKHRGELEKDLGDDNNIEWLEDNLRIRFKKKGHPQYRENWKEYHTWLIEKANAFKEVFGI